MSINEKLWRINWSNHLKLSERGFVSLMVHDQFPYLRFNTPYKHSCHHFFFFWNKSW